MQENIDINNLINSVKIKEIKEDVRFWLVRTQGGLFYNEFIESGFIAIAWNYLDKKAVLENKNEKDIKKTVTRLESKYSNVMKLQGKITKGQGRRAYNKCERFINELKVGDIVMVPSSQSSLITFAQVGNYYEIKENDFEKEMEVMSDIAPNGPVLHKCPYKKRREIKVLKTINSNCMNPNLFKALVSYHGLSNIDDFSSFILSSIYDAFYYNNKLNCVFNVKQRNGLDAIDLSNFIYSFSSLLKIDDKNAKITAKMNLNSPGEVVIALLNSGENIIEFINANKFWIIIGWFTLIGGSVGDLSFNGVLSCLLKYRETNSGKEKLALENEKLGLEIEKLKLETEAIKENLNRIKDSSKSLKIDKSQINNIIDLSEYFSEYNKSNDGDNE